jgi:hypothetical protein
MTIIYSVGPNRTTPASDIITRDGIRYIKRTAVAFNGPCMVTAEADDWFGGEDSRPYRSRLMQSPTWADLTRVAASQQKATRDLHHAFLEGAYPVGTETIKGQTVTVLRLLMGS